MQFIANGFFSYKNKKNKKVGRKIKKNDWAAILGSFQTLTVILFLVVSLVITPHKKTVCRNTSFPPPPLYSSDTHVGFVLPQNSHCLAANPAPRRSILPVQPLKHRYENPTAAPLTKPPIPSSPVDRDSSRAAAQRDRGSLAANPPAAPSGTRTVS